MNESQFSNIFISPLFDEKISLDEIDLDIHNEIIDLSNFFCMPSLILKSINYSKSSPNKVIQNLKEQAYIANLKNLINRKEIFKIAKLFHRNQIEYVFLKGSAINLLDIGYIRHARDIDILVSKECLSKAYKLLKGIGYIYRNPLVSDESKYISASHHLPVMTNNEGALVEIHHRVTDILSYKKCPLTEIMLKKYATIKINNVDLMIPKLNHLITHIVYHAVIHHKFNLGPIFLYDVKYLKNLIVDEKDLLNLLSQAGLEKDYMQIARFIENKKVIDSFGILKKTKSRKNINNFNYLLFSKKGRLDFLNKSINKFRQMEDIYQTSKYSIKFYFFLLVEFKNFFLKLIKLDGRDGRI